MLLELNKIRQTTDDDIQVMENAVGKRLSPVEVVDNSTNLKLSADFDNLYYVLAASADVLVYRCHPLSKRPILGQYKIS